MDPAHFDTDAVVEVDGAAKLLHPLLALNFGARVAFKSAAVTREREFILPFKTLLDALILQVFEVHLLQLFKSVLLARGGAESTRFVDRDFLRHKVYCERPLRRLLGIPLLSFEDCALREHGFALETGARVHREVVLNVHHVVVFLFDEFPVLVTGLQALRLRNSAHIRHLRVRHLRN